MTAARESETPRAERDAHERVPGYDVARALAICGMVLINFGVYLLGPPRGTPGEIVLRWLAHVPGGRASSLFVTLAGVGIARMAYGDVTRARKTLLLRAALLVGLGATNLALGWWIDILHFYACYLTIAAVFFLRATPRALVGSAIGVGMLGGVFALVFPEDGRTDVPRYSLEGVLRDALIDGIHPVLPWLAFLLFGMWLGQLDLRSTALRRRVLARALAVFVTTELASIALSALTVRSQGVMAGRLLGLWHTDWSPSPLYVLSASATATSVIALAHELVERAPGHRVTRVLGNAGQLSLTIYLVHAHLAIGIPRFLPWLASMLSTVLVKARAPITIPNLYPYLSDSLSIEQMLTYWAVFVLTVIPLAALYRSRFRRGPVEWAMRALSGSPDHVAPLAEDVSSGRPPRWAWPVLFGTIALLPIGDFVGIAPPRLSCDARRGLGVPGETASELTLLCPRARFALELDAPTSMVLTTRSGLDVYLEIRREGVMIDEDDDSGPGFDSRIEATLGPGRYDVDVRPYSAATGPFVLSVEGGPTRSPAAP